MTSILNKIIINKVNAWLLCTLKFELFLKKMAKAQPCRLRGHTRARPTRKTVL